MIPPPQKKNLVFLKQKMLLRLSLVRLPSMPSNHLLTRGCSEGKYRAYYNAHNVGQMWGIGSSCSKGPNTPTAFREGFFKTILGVKVVGCLISS